MTAKNTGFQTLVFSSIFSMQRLYTKIFNKVIKFYHDDLPNPSVVDTELSRWKIKWLHQTCLPYSLQETIQQCDAELSPIYTLY